MGNAEGCFDVPAQRFLNYRMDVCERVNILEVRQARRSDDNIQLSLRLLLYIWIEGHCDKDGLKHSEGLRS